MQRLILFDFLSFLCQLLLFVLLPECLSSLVMLLILHYGCHFVPVTLVHATHTHFLANLLASTVTLLGASSFNLMLTQLNSTCTTKY